MQLKVSCPECSTHFHLDRKKIPQEGLQAKEVVERLRRGKLELEHRAAQAEATIETLQKRGFLQRLLRRKR